MAKDQGGMCEKGGLLENEISPIQYTAAQVAPPHRSHSRGRKTCSG